MPYFFVCSKPKKPVVSRLKKRSKIPNTKKLPRDIEWNSPLLRRHRNGEPPDPPFMTPRFQGLQTGGNLTPHEIPRSLRVLINGLYVGGYKNPLIRSPLILTSTQRDIQEVVKGLGQRSSQRGMNGAKGVVSIKSSDEWSDFSRFRSAHLSDS